MTNFRHHPIDVQYQNLFLCADGAPNNPHLILPKLDALNEHLPIPYHQHRVQSSDKKPTKSLLSPTPTYTPEDQDSDSEIEENSQPLPIPLFPTPPYQPEADAVSPVQLSPAGEPLDDQVEAPHQDHVDLLPQLHLDLDLAQDIKDAVAVSPEPPRDQLAAPQQDHADLLPQLHLDPVRDVHDIQNQPQQSLHLYQPLYGQKSYLKPGDIVVLVQDDYWCKVILHSHTGRRDAMNHSLYWNYSALDGSRPAGGYLFPGQAWGVLRNELVDLDLSKVDIILPDENPNNPAITTNAEEAEINNESGAA